MPVCAPPAHCMLPIPSPSPAGSYRARLQAPATRLLSQQGFQVLLPTLGGPWPGWTPLFSAPCGASSPPTSPGSAHSTASGDRSGSPGAADRAFGLWASQGLSTICRVGQGPPFLFSALEHLPQPGWLTPFYMGRGWRRREGQPLRSWVICPRTHSLEKPKAIAYGYKLFLLMGHLVGPLRSRGLLTVPLLRAPAPSCSCDVPCVSLNRARPPPPSLSPEVLGLGEGVTDALNGGRYG